MTQTVTTETAVSVPVLSLSGIDAGYAKTRVLFDVELTVPSGAIVALIGANGAGKTTLLRVASGLLQPSRGKISVDGDDVTGKSPHQRAKRGVCLIPEGRGIFRSLTVRENLELQRPPWVDASAVDIALQAFPLLGERLSQIAGSLSGGQQQMLALSRALMSEPRVILLDEVSMGLAPIVVDQIFETLRELAKTKTSMVIVEQYVNRAISMADLVYLIDRGKIIWSGASSELDLDAVMASYLGEGTAAGGDEAGSIGSDMQGAIPKAPR
jgi:branched-chain amino acid transport system ATP-binding protein